MMLQAALGFVGWTLTEYLMHRFVGHEWDTPLRAYHLQHHDNPETTLDARLYALMALMLLGATFAAGQGAAGSGAFVGYCTYEAVHRRAHRKPQDDMEHWIHHATLNRNYGVTTHIWDTIFATRLK